MTNSADRPGNFPATQWRTRGVGDLSELAQARVEAINLVQWLARIANSYVGESEAELRTRLHFRSSDAAIVTRQFADCVALEIRLPRLEMQFLDDGKPVPHVFDPGERSPAEAEAWILVELLHRGVDREKFSKQLPYTVPGLMSGDAEDYSPQLCKHGLVQLTALFRDAAAILSAAAPAAEADKIRLICLPQRLELTTLSAPEGTLGEFAFSPGDAETPDPYFYVIAAARNRLAAGTTRPVLKASTLIAEGDPIAAADKLKTLARA